MPIHPIEYRYGTPEMKSIWTRESRFRFILQTEIALSKAESDVGLIPESAAVEIEKTYCLVKLSRVDEIEKKLNHEMAAIVNAISEQCSNDSGKWVHFGATSNDILDTATALQLKESIFILEKRLLNLLSVLVKLSMSHKKTVCCGRTHGQIGIPFTYGLRFCIWASEIDRHMDRLSQLKPRILVGKMTGAVGTQAAFGKHGQEIQKRTMKYLKLGSVDISNQVIQRDRHAEFVMWLAGVVTTLDKIGIEIRTLQRSEIAELEESFGKNNVGSSTMPHKKNPVKSEQICGLARIVRGFVETALQNNTLWDERDLTNSSSERIIFPEVCILTDYIIKSGTDVLSNLNFNYENIERNLKLLNGLNMSEPIMIELIKRGVGRKEAHEYVRKFVMNVQNETGGKKNGEIFEILSHEDIEYLTNPYNYIGTAVEQVESVCGKLVSKYDLKPEFQ